MSLLDEALCAHLLNAASVSAIVDTRVYMVHVPTDITSFPRIVISAAGGGTNVRYMGGLSGLVEAHRVIDCQAHSEDAAAAKALADVVRLLLDTFSGTLGSGGITTTVSTIILQPEFDVYMPPTTGKSYGIHISRLMATIWHRQTTS